jgi:hypothetical protein
MKMDDREPLVISAVAMGRYVHVTTYCDGPDGVSPQKARLLFRRPEEAEECVRVLTEAKKPL